MREHAMTKEFLFLLLLAALWGASYSFIKIGVATIPPLTLIAARTLIAGVLLAGLARWRGLKLPRDGATWRRFLVQACLGSALPFTLIAWAEQSIDAGLATILNATTPLFAFLMTAFIIRHEAVAPRQFAGVALGLAGICLIVGVGALSGLGREALAQLAVVAASICYAGGAIFGKGFRDMPPILPAAGSLLCGAAILVPASLVVDRPWTLAPSSASLTALIALSVFSTALAFVIYFRLMRTLGTVGTTAQAYLRAPIGVAIGVAFLGETLPISAGLGLVLVLAGVTLMSRAPRLAPAR